MAAIPTNLDYDEVQRHHQVKIDGKLYIARVGSPSESQAIQEAKYFKDRGYTRVKIITCRSYYVCVPAEENSAVGNVLSGAARVVKGTVKTAHNVSGELLSRNAKGEAAVKKLLDWDRKH